MTGDGWRWFVPAAARYAKAPEPVDIKAGDIVTRDGTDLQRVLWIDGDLLEVECIKAPLGSLNDDGTRAAPWCNVGDRETNLTRRYDLAGELIDGEFRALEPPNENG